MLYLTDPVDGKPFDEQDQWLIETTAGYAALAIAGAQLREQRERLTLFEERERIGMELHDGVIQSLYAVGMQLELARTAGSIHPDDFIAPIQSLNQTIEDIRSYILDLHRHNTTSTTIISCLKSMTNRLHIPDTLKIEIDAPDTPISIPNVLFEAVCQMVNEAISNVIRHANATKVTISAYLANGHFYLTISDNGQGFDFDQQIALSTSELSEIGATGSGLGLRNIQRRARLHHGTVEIASTKGRGTQISLSLPISGS
jgi:signal transduction histidine kinase